MFINNKYTKIYMVLMNSRKLLDRKRKDKQIYDNHHIIPKSMGGSNKKSNMILLTPKEHYISHLLLTKMVKTKIHRRGMFCAMVRFLGKNKSKYTIKNTSRMYQYIVEKNREHMIGKNNPFYGKHHTKEWKEKKREELINKFTGKDNPFYGKHHTKEMKEYISNIRSMNIMVTFYNGTIIELKNRRELGLFLGKSQSLGSKLLLKTQKHLWKKYNIKRIEFI